MEYKVGDIITHMSGMYGESHAIITTVNETGIEAWDFEYGVFITRPFGGGDKPSTWFKKTSASRLDASISFFTDSRKGSFTVRQLAEEAAAKFSITANFGE